jgi:hypothetical protein
VAEDTRKDSADMKFIAFMTMAFLPGKFFAALFPVPTLQWNYDDGGGKDQQQQGQGLIGKRFWVYWAFTMPTTLMIFIMWDALNDQRILGRLSRLLWASCCRPMKRLVGKKRQATPDVEI